MFPVKAFISHLSGDIATVEIQVPSACEPRAIEVCSFKRKVGQNITLHASPAARKFTIFVSPPFNSWKYFLHILSLVFICIRCG